MTLQHARKAVAHLGIWRSDCDRARDVGRAVEILRAGIEQVERPRFERLFALRRRPVMHDCAVRPGPRDRRKAQITETLALAAEGFKPVARGDLAQIPFWRLARQPSQKARHGGTVAAMRSAGAIEFARVLAGFRQQTWVGGAMDIAARRREPVEHPGSGGCRGGLHPRARHGQRGEGGAGMPHPPDADLVAEMAIQGGAEVGVGPKCPTGSMLISLPRWRSRPGKSLRRSMNSRTLPSSRRIAKDSGSGVCGTSPPRMLSSQAIDSGIVNTAAATSTSERPRASLARLSEELSPAKRSACGTTGASGAAAVPARPGRPDCLQLCAG